MGNFKCIKPASRRNKSRWPGTNQGKKSHHNLLESRLKCNAHFARQGPPRCSVAEELPSHWAPWGGMEQGLLEGSLLHLPRCRNTLRLGTLCFFCHDPGLNLAPARAVPAVRWMWLCASFCCTAPCSRAVSILPCALPCLPTVCVRANRATGGTSTESVNFKAFL